LFSVTVVVNILSEALMVYLAPTRWSLAIFLTSGISLAISAGLFTMLKPYSSAYYSLVFGLFFGIAAGARSWLQHVALAFGLKSHERQQYLQCFQSCRPLIGTLGVAVAQAIFLSSMHKELCGTPIPSPSS
jgi:hypothetical protein